LEAGNARQQCELANGRDDGHVYRFHLEPEGDLKLRVEAAKAQHGQQVSEQQISRLREEASEATPCPAGQLDGCRCCGRPIPSMLAARRATKLKEREHAPCQFASIFRQAALYDGDMYTETKLVNPDDPEYRHLQIDPPPNDNWGWVSVGRKRDVGSQVSDERYAAARAQLRRLVADGMEWPDAVRDGHAASCAVVGSSGKLKRAEAGMRLDEYSLVMRMNGARTQGFELYVGSHTSLHVIASTGVERLLKENGCWEPQWVDLEEMEKKAPQQAQQQGKGGSKGAPPPTKAFKGRRDLALGSSSSSYDGQEAEGPGGPVLTDTGIATSEGRRRARAVRLPQASNGSQHRTELLSLGSKDNLWQPKRQVSWLKRHHCDGGAQPWCPVGAILLNTCLEGPLEENAQHHSRRGQMFYALNRSCHQVARLGAMTREQRELANALFKPPDKNFMSGLAGLLVMSMLCDNGVDVYGFDTGTEPKDTPFHYYDDVTPAHQLDELDDSQKMLRRIAGAGGSCVRLRD
jgi:hypothetical protein